MTADNQFLRSTRRGPANGGAIRKLQWLIRKQKDPALQSLELSDVYVSHLRLAAIHLTTARTTQNPMDTLQIAFNRFEKEHILF
jgi:hypothetical protein